MSKRFFSVSLLFLCSVFLAGCNEVTDLTDEETALIAEYAAELLLKYDLSYVDRIAEGDRQAEEISAGAESAEQLQVTTQAATDRVKEKAEQTTSNGNSTEEANPISVSGGGNIAQSMGLSGVSVICKDYVVSKRYSGQYADEVDLEAAEGYQLMVVQFDVENVTEETVSFSMLDRTVGYSIVCDGTVLADSMLTILPHDLGTLEASLEPGEKQEAVLIFQISDSRIKEFDTIELNIQYNGMNDMIKIL